MGRLGHAYSGSCALPRKTMGYSNQTIEGEVAVFSTKGWDLRSSEGLIESAAPCHDLYSHSTCLTVVLTAKSGDYINHCAKTPS